MTSSKTDAERKQFHQMLFDMMVNNERRKAQQFLHGGTKESSSTIEITRSEHSTSSANTSAELDIACPFQRSRKEAESSRKEDRPVVLAPNRHLIDGYLSAFPPGRSKRNAVEDMKEYMGSMEPWARDLMEP